MKVSNFLAFSFSICTGWAFAPQIATKRHAKTSLPSAEVSELIPSAVYLSCAALSFLNPDTKKQIANDLRKQFREYFDIFPHYVANEVKQISSVLEESKKAPTLLTLPALVPPTKAVVTPTLATKIRNLFALFFERIWSVLAHFFGLRPAIA